MTDSGGMPQTHNEKLRNMQKSLANEVTNLQKGNEAVANTSENMLRNVKIYDK